MKRLPWLLLSLALAASALAAPAGNASPSPLQPWIDSTPAGGILRLLPGAYTGPATISRPIVLDGANQASLDGNGKGRVLTIAASGVTVRNLTILNSGGSHDQLDSGIYISGNDNIIENNIIENTLFGITLQHADGNILRNNRIRSMPWDSADRGDGIRLWYSRHNLIEGNDIAQVRDLTITNSPYNRFIGNRIVDSRRAMNFLFSHRSLIASNEISRNSTGIAVLNSEGMIIRNNRLTQIMDTAGDCIALKESSAVLIIGNEIVRCSVGILASSPMNPVNRIAILDNRIAHNITGISFYGERRGHLIFHNRFEHNLWQAMVGEGSDPLAENDWYGNYWDDYEGFDRDHDGIGDTPYEIWAWSDRIWMEEPKAKFFRNAPALEMLDFLERLAPFASPSLILRDEAPRMRPEAAEQKF
ncbi:MAG: nitrous oxide reductase family maturation protein NosD [Betaproteobacteria bacterium]|nr:nitrous oxide reductase family maturation protein NosD [Betaproteobacteria bacterium]